MNALQTLIRSRNPTFSVLSVFPPRFFTWIESRLVLFFGSRSLFARSFSQLFAAPILQVSPVSDTPRTSRAPTPNRTPCPPPPPPHSPRAPSSRASASAPPRPSGASRPTGRARKLTHEKEPRKVSGRPDPDQAPDATFARFVRGISSIDAFVSSDAICPGIWRVLIRLASSRRRWPRAPIARRREKIFCGNAGTLVSTKRRSEPPPASSRLRAREIPAADPRGKRKPPTHSSTGAPPASPR